MSNPDDLDDGLVYDFSEQEEENLVSDNGPETVVDINSKKHGLSDDEKETPLGEENNNKLSKRQKKLQGSKLRQKKKEQIEFEINKKKNIPKSNTDVISEYFATFIRDKNPDLSALELDELYLKKSNFISTETFNNDRSLDNFSDFMIKYSKAPKSIIISMSNMRVADVARQLGGAQSSVKLFAKNKLDQDVKTVNSILLNNKTSHNKANKSKDANGKKNKKPNQSSTEKDIKYFIATPNRLEKIFENTDAFFQGKDKLDIILDASHLDNKDNSLIAFENTMVLCKVLKTILDNKSSVKILLY